MKQVAAALRERVASTEPKLRAMPEAEAAHKPAPDRWSKKEILGHLIDSASNNHQRFVRSQLEGGLTFPGYEQEGWARCQHYASADWGLLIDLWSSYNRHLAEVIELLPPAATDETCRIGSYDPMTLAAVVEDYVVHLDHHLAQLARPVPAS
ncbi:DinB superfamily protein [Pirellulimonas nuda]|uniref:DinB superfamily protein n=1 Tax=Pirellulimonas nuda TaxID=2528009 RepID=A0A518D8N0_9BACT|nr:DinB family protein [Pirellulimonas nuda]QDU87841.1 DinB superfamily protein [Pirellulimonas nuda]